MVAQPRGAAGEDERGIAVRKADDDERHRRTRQGEIATAARQWLESLELGKETGTKLDRMSKSRH
jgi:hypothetical protein